MRTFSLPILLLLLAASAAAAPAEPKSSTLPSTSTADHKTDCAGFFPVQTSAGDKTVLSMQVGSVLERHEAWPLPPGRTATATAQTTASHPTLLLSFVVPDDAPEHQYNVELATGGQVFHRRSGPTRGFGRRTLFVPVPPALVSGTSLTVSLSNRSNEPFYISEFYVLNGLQEFLRRPAPPDDFLLGLLVNDPESTPLLQLAGSLPDAPGVRKAISHEVYFAAKQPEELRHNARLNRRSCEELGLAFLPVVCSWWAGTPPEIRERPEFQQVCWSETDNLDEGPELRRLLGDRWDLRYGWTIPNKWSSTPWQTMNHPELNRMRHERLAGAVRILEEEMGPGIVGYVTENEPAYWAFEGSDNEYPVRRENLWADFNPHAVEAARQDGVTLDPADGLDLVERVWLHHNASRYQQETADVVRETSHSGRLYSHALLDYSHFPFAGTDHARPYADIARLQGARTGIEMIWKVDTDALWRVREWGPWGCVNREEWDGYSIDYHVATLRACYMMGADMLNSYNWHRMGREGDPKEYFTTFLEDLSKRDGVVEIGARSGGKEWHPLTRWDAGIATDDASSWANALELPLRAAADASPLRVTMRREYDGPIVAEQLLFPSDAAGEKPVRIRFGDYTRTEQGSDLQLYLESDGGWEYQGSWYGPDYRLLLDLNEERRRSLYSITRDSAVTSAPLRLIGD